MNLLRTVVCLVSIQMQRHHILPEDDIIRSRLLYEGDQGIDDRRILNLIKTFHKYIEIDLSNG
jgi:hypothetical protein